MPLVDIVGLYEELLLDASYRGIPFSVVDSRDAGGRRVQAFLFPGVDRQAFHDLGQSEGDIVVNGIIVGDDYVRQAERLRHAFRDWRPATLVLPWIGDVFVVQAPGRPPEISFSHDRLRVVTFQATFRRFDPLKPTPLGTLQSLLDGLSDLRAAARSLLRQILAPAALVLSTIGQVTSLAGEMATLFGRLILSTRAPLVGITGSAPIGLLKTLAGVPLDDDYPDTVADRMAGPAAAIAGTSLPVLPAAVAPGGSTTLPEAVDPRITAGLILDVVTGIAPLATAPLARQQLAACAQALMLAEAATAASDIAYDSQQDAAAWRDRIAAALDAAATLAVSLVPGQPTAAAALWRGLVDARAAWLSDMTTTIGRLPAVRRFTPREQVPAWVLAHYLVGDDPSQVLGVWNDLVRRNDLRHPALPPPGPLETLA